MSATISIDSLLFDELHKIYNFEFQRWKALDEKAMHIASSNGAILALFFGLIAVTIDNIQFGDRCMQLLNIVSITVISSMFAFSIVESSRAIKTKSFLTTDPKVLIEEYSERSVSEYYEHHRTDLENDIIKNRKMNSEKAKMINISLYSLCIGVVSLVIYVLVIITGLAIT